jgi:hypothetical protein
MSAAASHPGRAWLAAALLVLGAAAGSAAPLPPGRPSEFGRGGTTPPAPPSPPLPVPPTAPAPPTVTPAPPDTGCLEALRAAGATAEVAAQPKPGDASCQIENPVRLTAIAMPGGKGAVAVPEGPVVACRFARPFADWLGGIAAPVLGAARGAPLKAVRTGPGFECRSRNRQGGEKPSAHGLGLAIDIASFEFAAGPVLAIKADGHSDADAAGLAAIRQAACGWFTTVLGPGADPYHADHLHLDIQLHGSSDRYRICQ